MHTMITKETLHRPRTTAQHQSMIERHKGGMAQTKNNQAGCFGDSQPKNGGLLVLKGSNMQEYQKSIKFLDAIEAATIPICIFFAGVMAGYAWAYFHFC